MILLQAAAEAASDALFDPEMLIQSGGVVGAVIVSVQLSIKGLAKRLDRVESKVDDVSTRVARIEGQHERRA